MIIGLDALDCVCPKRLAIGIIITRSAFESALPSDEKKENRVVITSVYAKGHPYKGMPLIANYGRVS